MRDRWGSRAGGEDVSLVSDLQNVFEVSEEDALLIAEDPEFARGALTLQRSSNESLDKAQRALDELSQLRLAVLEEKG